MEKMGTVFFALAVLHTFLCGRFLLWSHHFPEGSLRREILHLCGEVEVVFGLWATLFFAIFALKESPHSVIQSIQSINFTEPMFVFVIMVIAATRPILSLSREVIVATGALLRKMVPPLSVAQGDLLALLTLGPLAGSFITEPAAMTVTAMLLRSMFQQVPIRLAYALLGVLFVNISIGGALTPMAAPPILMVARLWNWDFATVFSYFGWKTIIAVSVNSLVLILIFAGSLKSGVKPLAKIADEQKLYHGAIPVGITALHLCFLALVVLTSHYQNVFFGIFLLFLGVSVVTRRYQDSLRLRESLLVAFFLAGIVAFGPYQKWWLAPLLSQLSEGTLYLGAILLTAVTDNAALTYLGSQVPNLGEGSRYALVAGAIAGGGLTLIANAPNAAGYALLNGFFPQRRLEPLWLFVAALGPTLVAAFCLWR